jgi:transposase
MYVGIDVDDSAFHASALFVESGELIEIKCRPTAKGLDTKLKEISKKYPKHKMKLCYEATYIGFSLKRELEDLGYDCVVVSPSSIPRVHGNQVKTDRLDAGKLAQFLASGLLTIVSVPEKEEERDRDLMRSRQFVLHQLSEIRTHIQSLLRRNGIHFKSETGSLAHWTDRHMCWLDRKIDAVEGSLKLNLKFLVQQMKWLDHTLNEYGSAVEELAKSEKYKKRAESLVCYHGIKNIFAMTMITEIGDVNRFAHPNKLTSWMGFDIREYSSGGKHNRLGITKHGNKYLRTAFVEANQRLPKNQCVSKVLKSRRQDIDIKFIAIADRCRERISKKGKRLLFSGKHPNKVKVACAREMVGFVWESLRAAA